MSTIPLLQPSRWERRHLAGPYLQREFGIRFKPGDFPIPLLLAANGEIPKNMDVCMPLIYSSLTFSTSA